MIDREGLGQRLASARKAAEMKQTEAGELLGVPKDTISRWERGQNEPTFLAVAELARSYGVSLDWLSGSATHESGLRLGHTVVDLRALQTLRAAQRNNKRLLDLREYTSGPAFNCAFDIPDDPVVIDQKTAKKLHYEIETLLAKIRDKEKKKR